jgi:histidinol-phosphate/aromatic aminotransferase/cobyric acid decarboxylase-like protein
MFAVIDEAYADYVPRNLERYARVVTEVEDYLWSREGGY